MFYGVWVQCLKEIWIFAWTILLGANVQSLFIYLNISLKVFQNSGQKVAVFKWVMCVCVWEAAWSALPCHVWWYTVGQCSDWRSHSQSLFCAVSEQLARMDLPLPPAREARQSLRPHKHNTVSPPHAHTGPIMERCLSLISCSSAPHESLSHPNTMERASPQDFRKQRNLKQSCWFEITWPLLIACDKLLICTENNFDVSIGL